MKVKTNRNAINQQKTILLSIGMIVKNEEKYLKGCLEALKPLREKLGDSCQLVIADTGSTDGTKEIALEFADKVLDFEWCNDFAQARNFVLDNCSSQWHLFIDADEYLQSFKDIIMLVTTQNDYDGANIVIENKVEKEKGIEDVKLSEGLRIFRVKPENRFKFPIHEAVYNLKKVCKISDKIKHYGYESHDFLINKIRTRNLPLLLALEQSDNSDGRIYGQLAQEYMVLEEYDNVIKTCEKGIEASQKESDNESLIISFRTLKAYALNSIGKRDEALKLAQETLDSKKGVWSIDIEAYALMGTIYIELKNYKEAIIYYKKYLDLYELCRKGQADINFSASNAFADLSNSEYYYSNIAKNLLMLEFEQKNYNEVCNITSKIIFSIPIEMNVIFFNYLLTSVKNEEKIELLNKICDELKENTLKSNIENFWKAYFNIAFEKNYKLRDAFYDLYDKNNKCIYSDITNIAYKYIDNIITENDMDNIKILWDLVDGYYKSFLLLCLFESNCSKDIIFSYLNSKNTIEIYQNFFEADNKIYYHIENFCNNINIDNTTIQQFFIISLLCEKCLNNFSIMPRGHMEFFRNYILILINIIKHTYSNDFIDSNEYSFISPAHQFGIYALKAQNEIANNDELEAMKTYLIGADCYPIILPFIKIMVEDFEEDITNIKNEKIAIKGEMEMLTEEVKKTIYELMQSRDIQNAKEIFKELVQIVPNDPDILKIKAELENLSE